MTMEAAQTNDGTHDGPLIIFRSIPGFWQKEFAGLKPNTERIVDPMGQTRAALVRASLAVEAGQPATIEIINSETGDIFFRRITDISAVGNLLGRQMYVISWQHEDGTGTYRDPDEED